MDYIARTVSVTYTLVPGVPADGLYELERHEVSSEKVGMADPIPKNISTIVADHLDVSQMSCQWVDTNGDGELNEEDNTFTLKVVSVVGTKTEERTYNISPRSLG